MDNQFLVQPAQYGQGLAGLGQSLAQAGEVKRKREKEEQLLLAKQEEKEELEQVYSQAEEALANKDYDAINEISIRYPKVSESILSALGAKDEREQKNIVETGFKVLQNPENYNQIIDENPIFAEQMGGADLAKKVYAENPEKTLDQARQLLSWTGKDQWKQFREYEKSKTVDQVDLQYKDGVIFNPRTGETTQAAVQPDAKKPTLKEVKGGVKYFTDGSEQPIGDSEQVKNPVTGKRFTPQQAQSVLADAKEFQLKNGGFAVTLDSGLTKVDQMYSEGYDPTKAAWVDAAFGGDSISNLLKSEEDQVFMGAVDEMINAIARRETGAAITEFERKDFFNRYMPRPGDTKKRLSQKRNSLERQLKSIAGQSGGVYEALKITGDDERYTPQEQIETTVVIQAHPQYGDISEADIQQTMSDMGMTREQVMSRLGGQ